MPVSETAQAEVSVKRVEHRTGAFIHWSPPADLKAVDWVDHLRRRLAKALGVSEAAIDVRDISPDSVMTDVPDEWIPFRLRIPLSLAPQRATSVQAWVYPCSPRAHMKLWLSAEWDPDASVRLGTDCQEIEGAVMGLGEGAVLIQDSRESMLAETKELSALLADLVEGWCGDFCVELSALGSTSDIVWALVAAETLDDAKRLLDAGAGFEGDNLPLALETINQLVEPRKPSARTSALEHIQIEQEDDDGLLARLPCGLFARRIETVSESASIVRLAGLTYGATEATCLEAAAQLAFNYYKWF